MSYTDLDPEYYEGGTEQPTQHYEMQFADPDWQPDPEPTYPVYDRPTGVTLGAESNKWVDVPFHVAWLFYGLFVFMGQLFVFGFSTLIFQLPLGVYILWGILSLLSLPFVSYWWTKHARYRHYKN